MLSLLCCRSADDLHPSWELESPPETPVQEGPFIMKSGTKVFVLQGTKLSCTVLQSVASLIPAPAVQYAVGAALQIIQIIEAVNANEEACTLLQTQICGLMLVVVTPLQGKTDEDIPDGLMQNIKRLSGDLQEIMAVLVKIDGKDPKGRKSFGSRVRAIVTYSDRSQKLKDCASKLQWAVQLFQVDAQIRSVVDDAYRYAALRGDTQALRTDTAKILQAVRKLENITFTQPSAPLVLPSTEIPPMPEIFHGRDEYVQSVVARMLSSDSARLAIRGPGGMGKTSTALAVIHDPHIVERFGNYRHWIPCDQATSLALFIELLARSLDVVASSHDRLKDVMSALRASTDNPRLLLIDNFETPLDIEGKQHEVEDILQQLSSVPNLSLLITMRNALLPSRLKWTRPPLPTLDQLSIEAARLAFLDISPSTDENDKDLDELLKALDCVPLAINLMATVAQLERTPSELLTQWKERRTEMLHLGDDHLSSVEMSIRLSMQSSTMKANDPALRLLEILSWLPGGAKRDRLGEIAPSISEVNSAVDTLLRVSLAHMSPDKTAVTLLSPVRNYLLKHHPLEDDALVDLFHAYYNLANKASMAYQTPELPMVIQQFAPEEANFDTLFTTALLRDDERRNAIAAALCYSVYYLSQVSSRTDILLLGVDAARKVEDKSLLGVCLRSLGDIYRAQGRYELAWPCLEEAKNAFAEVEDRREEAGCLRSLGDILHVQSKYEQSESLLQEARSIFQEAGDKRGEAYCLRTIGDIFYVQSKYNEAEATLRQSREMFHELGYGRDEASCLKTLGDLLRIQHLWPQAHSVLDEARVMFKQTGNLGGMAESLQSLGDILSLQYQFSDAEPYFLEALATFEQLGDTRRMAWCRQFLGDVYGSQGKLEEARECLELGRAVLDEQGDKRGVGWCLRSLGIVSRRQERYDEAWATVEQARALFEQLRDVRGQAFCLRTLGSIGRLQGHLEESKTAMQAAKEKFIQLKCQGDADQCQSFLQSVEDGTPPPENMIP